MKTSYDASLKSNLLHDDEGKVRAINHLDEFPEQDEDDGGSAALAYLRTAARTFGVPEEELKEARRPLSYWDPEPRGREFRLRDEKKQFDLATFVFNQTFLNLPVWEAGLTLTLKQAPWRAISSTDTSARDVDAEMPSKEAVARFRRLFLSGEKIDQPKRGAKVEEATPIPASNRKMAPVLQLIGASPATPAAARPQGRSGLIRGRFYVYRYQERARFDPDAGAPPKAGERPERTDNKGHAHGDGEPLCGTPPRFPGPIPPVADGIKDGGWYVVAELVFRRPLANGSRMNWRALVEVETGSVLYLRALTSAINGLVFDPDPITKTGDATLTPNRTAADLDPHRVSRTLDNLNAPGATQALSGTRTFITETSDPAVAAPTRPPGSDFDFGSRTNDFAAVNAYYHTERFFQTVENLGFSLPTYFGGTTFPIETDHRGLGSAINAQCIGDGDGIDFHQYALADDGDTANPIGIATVWQVVLHELGGHGILYDHVSAANFGFAHSAGDSIAIILNDPTSAWHSGGAIDRFLLAPFVPAVPRFSDRGVTEQSVATITVTNGGSGYTSNPTVTISGGGGTGARAGNPARSGGVITGIPVAVPGRHFTSAPTVTITGGGGSGATATANLGTWGWGAGMDRGGYRSEELLSTTMFRVYRSLGGDSGDLARRQFAARATVYLILGAVGTLSPVSNPATPAEFLTALRTADAADWSSEGLAGGAYNKVLTWAFEKQNLNGGARPAVDVYIDDGRGGEYPYQPVHWANVSIWNRTIADGVEEHQPPVPGVASFAYCKVRNRGTSAASGTVVRAFHCLPSAGVTWPVDFQPMTTASLPVASVGPNSTDTQVVGPFTWTPNANAWGHDCILMIASATGDPSNVDLLAMGEVYADWRLVPHDNNVGQRNVVFPEGGLADGGLKDLDGKGFWIGNPSRRTATITVEVALPPVLKRAGWQLAPHKVPKGGVRLKPGERRLVTFAVRAGSELDPRALANAKHLDVVVTARSNGAIIGGMTYRFGRKRGG